MCIYVQTVMVLKEFGGSKRVGADPISKRGGVYSVDCSVTHSFIHDDLQRNQSTHVSSAFWNSCVQDDRYCNSNCSGFWMCAPGNRQASIDWHQDFEHFSENVSLNWRSWT